MIEKRFYGQRNEIIIRSIVSGVMSVVPSSWLLALSASSHLPAAAPSSVLPVTLGLSADGCAVPGDAVEPHGGVQTGPASAG